MIKNCLPAVPTRCADAPLPIGPRRRRTWTGAGGRGVANVVLALLIAGAAQSYGQVSPGQGLGGSAEQADACSGIGPGADYAVCRGAGEPGQSKYNLLYVDDTRASEGADITRPCRKRGPSDRAVGRTADGPTAGGVRNRAMAAPAGIL